MNQQSPSLILTLKVFPLGVTTEPLLRYTGLSRLECLDSADGDVAVAGADEDGGSQGMFAPLFQACSQRQHPLSSKPGAAWLAMRRGLPSVSVPIVDDDGVDVAQALQGGGVAEQDAGLDAVGSRP